MSIQSKNLFVAEKLKTIASLLSLEDNSIWKVKAYQKAYDLVLSLDVPIDSISDFETYSGIGKNISDSILEIIKTGKSSRLESLKEKFPKAEEALKLTIVSGIGVKKALGFYNQGITTFEELVKACEEGKISNQQIVRGVQLAQRSRGRLAISEVSPVANHIFKSLQARPEVSNITFAGSYRRGSESIKDVDIIVVSSDIESTTNHFQTFGDVLISGKEKSRIMAKIDVDTSVQIDLLFSTPDSFGSALAYFTGSKENNIAIRRLANSLGYTINEHGYYKLSTGERVGGKTEQELYDLLSIPYCPPELRDSEIRTSIPKLIDSSLIKSDWHTHSVWSADASSTIDEMVSAAVKKGLTTIGFSDHTEKQYGWDTTRIQERRLECEAASKKYQVQVFAGCETGVNKDGTLDWSDDLLSKMDYVIASIHKSHSTDPVKRLIAAARHPKVKIIGHPTGRIIGRRDIPEDDWKELFKVCANENVLIEINGARLDLPISFIKTAKEFGTKFILNSDAHNVDQLIWQDHAVSIAKKSELKDSDLKVLDIV